MVSTVSDTFTLQLASSIKSHKLWCQARALLLPVLQSGKISGSKLIHYFSGQLAVFGFWACLPPDNILSDFQTGIGAAADTILDTEQLISLTRTALVDTISSPQGSVGGVITASEVHELLTNIHEILDNAVSK